MRVLHLMDQADGHPQPVLLAMLHDSVGRLGAIQEQVALLGGAELAAAAQSVGLSNTLRLGVPLRQPLLGLPALLRQRGRWGAFDIVHAWSPAALLLAALAFRGRTIQRLLTVARALSSSEIRLLRVLQDVAGPSLFLTISNTLRRELIAGGVEEKWVHVLRPGIDLGRIAHGRRNALRQEWELPTAQTKVVALLADRPEQIDARSASLAMSLAQECLSGETIGSGVHERQPLRLLLHPRQSHRLQALRLLRPLGRQERLINEERLERPWEVLPGCDLALALGETGCELSLLWAMAGNVPIIGEATYGLSEIVEDRHSALLSKPRQTKALANRIQQLAGDDQLAWRLRDTARHEAFSFFSRLRYCQNLALVYQQLHTGSLVTIPPLPVTGGLRFSGRA